MVLRPEPALRAFIQDFRSTLISFAEESLPSSAPAAASFLLPSPGRVTAQLLPFVSLAEDLVYGDTNGCPDVYARDMRTGTHILISVNTNRFAANGPSWQASGSADSRYVALASYASDLVPGDTNNCLDVFMRDLADSSTRLISSNFLRTGPGDRPSYAPILSRDGKRLVFLSAARNLSPKSFYPGMNVFFRHTDYTTNIALTTQSAESKVAATPGLEWVAFTERKPESLSYETLWLYNAASNTQRTLRSQFRASAIALSPDGQWLAYGTNHSSQRTLGEVHLMRCSTMADQTLSTNRLVGELRFSDDSRFLVFAGIGPAPSYCQVYLHDLAEGSSLLLSRQPHAPVAANGDSESPDISPDGRFVAFRSLARDLTPGDTNGVADVFVVDRETGTLVNLTSSAQRPSSVPVFASNGRSLFFLSLSGQSAADFNESLDVFQARLFPDPEIPAFEIALTKDASGKVLTWPATPGAAYQVHYLDQASAGRWSLATGTQWFSGGQGYFQDEVQDASQRLYRVVAE